MTIIEKMINKLSIGRWLVLSENYRFPAPHQIGFSLLYEYARSNRHNQYFRCYSGDYLLLYSSCYIVSCNDKLSIEATATVKLTRFKSIVNTLPSEEVVAWSTKAFAQLHAPCDGI